MDLNFSKVKLEHQDAFKALIQDYNQSIKVLAVFGYGSYFSGNYHVNSDIDLVVLSDSTRYEKKLTDDGLLFEVFNIGFKRLRFLLDKYNECYVPAIYSSEIIYDPFGAAQKLKNLANIKYDNKPPYYHTDRVINILRSKIRTFIFDMKDSISDTMLFTLLLHQLILLVYKVLCFQFKEWGKGEKNMFMHIDNMSPSIYLQIKECFNAQENYQKMILSENLVTKVLAPFGGILALDELLVC